MAGYTKLIDTQFVHVSDLGKRRTRREIPAYVAAHGDYHATYKITRLSWSIEGMVAIVDAQIQEHLPDHDGAIVETDIFVRQGDRWMYRHHDETEIVQTAPRVLISAEILVDYVGSFRSSKGIIDVISTDGSKLFDNTLPEQGKTELIPVGIDAFAIANDPTLLTFTRDRTGKVVQCLWHLPSGQIVASPRDEAQLLNTKTSRQ